MTNEERRNAINWMLDQIESIEKRDQVLHFGETKVEVCDNDKRVHCYGEGFALLAEAVGEELQRKFFVDGTDALSFKFLGATFFRLVPAEKEEAEDEEPAE